MVRQNDGRYADKHCTHIFIGAGHPAGVVPKTGAGAGTLVPITGFANSVVSPAIEFKAEGWVTGVGAKIFTIAGPVIAFGTLASFVWGVVYWLVVTAAFLLYTFGPKGNGQPQYSWFIWAVAGVLFGAVMLVVKLIARRK